MTSIKKNWKRALAMILAVVMCVMALPMSAFAAVASDLPDNMADHAILRALEYTGYLVMAMPPPTDKMRFSMMRPKVSSLR